LTNQDVTGSYRQWIEGFGKIDQKAAWPALHAIGSAVLLTKD